MINNDVGRAGIIVFMFMPKGWVYLSVVNQCLWTERYAMGSLDPTGPIFHLALNERGLKEAQKWATNQWRSPITTLAGLWAQVLPAQNQRAAMRQSQLNLAYAAIALERFRLAKKAYPERLEELVPAYLSKVPHDVLEGRPLVYRRTVNGFQLYGLGLDGADDGGRMELKDGVFGPDWAWPEMR